MKVVLAGAFGNLGAEILKSLCADGHEVVAADMREVPVAGCEGKYTFVKIDATKPDTMKGLCDGAEVVITTVGLTGASTAVTSCDEPGAEKVPMLHAKYLVEAEIKKQPMDWVIYRPTGYFYDIAKVFKPYVDKGEMQLLKGYGGVKANVIDCPDFAKFIVDTMGETNVTYNVGGKETYTYTEMAEMCFKAAGKPMQIKWAPIWLFGILANLPMIKKAGKHDIILFSKWTLSHDLVGDTMVGEGSFKKYLNEYFGGN